MAGDERENETINCFWKSFIKIYVFAVVGEETKLKWNFVPEKYGQSDRRTGRQTAIQSASQKWDSDSDSDGQTEEQTALKDKVLTALFRPLVLRPAWQTHPKPPFPYDHISYRYICIYNKVAGYIGIGIGIWRETRWNGLRGRATHKLAYLLRSSQLATRGGMHPYSHSHSHPRSWHLDAKVPPTDIVSKQKKYLNSSLELLTPIGLQIGDLSCCPNTAFLPY